MTHGHTHALKGVRVGVPPSTKLSVCGPPKVKFSFSLLKAGKCVLTGDAPGLIASAEDGIESARSAIASARAAYKAMSKGSVTVDGVFAAHDKYEEARGAVDEATESARAKREELSQKDDDGFNELMRKPFLLSEERDELLKGLEEQGFFEKFDYDAKLPGWVATDNYVRKWEEK